MRAAISLLVSSLVFGSLGLNCEALLKSFSNLLLAVNSHHPNESDSPAPHRGSGRMESVQYFGNIYAAV